MPVVPEPPEEAMPRTAMALVSLLSKDTPGVNRTTSEKSLMPLMSMASRVSTLTLIGTRFRDSSWRVAVTVTSSSTEPPVSASAAACASAAPAHGAYASTTATATATACAAIAGPPARRGLEVGCMMSPYPSYRSNARVGKSAKLARDNSATQRLDCAAPLDRGAAAECSSIDAITLGQPLAGRQRAPVLRDAAAAA